MEMNPKLQRDERQASANRYPVKQREALLAVSAILGRKWHPLILYSLLQTNKMQFNELKEEIDGISGKMLSESLESLRSEYDLIERDCTDNSRVIYSLTARGEDLEPLFECMNIWGQKHRSVLDRTSA